MSKKYILKKKKNTTRQDAKCVASSISVLSDHCVIVLAVIIVTIIADL